jgi:hypothetical protein
VVAGSLHIVVPAQRISAGSCPHVIAGDEQQVRNSGRDIRTLAVLGYTHCPENTHTLSLGDHVRHDSDGVFRDTRQLGCCIEAERFQALSVFRHPIHPLAQKLRVCEAIVQKIARDRVYPNQVGCRFRVQEEVCPPCHFMLTQVRDNELLPVQFVSALYPCRNNWMSLRRVAANDENKFGLFHVGDGPRIAAVAHSPEQTLGRGRLAIAGTIIDVVRANHGSRQFLH